MDIDWKKAGEETDKMCEGCEEDCNDIKSCPKSPYYGDAMRAARLIAPSSMTKLQLNVADKTPQEVVDELHLIADIITFIQNGDVKCEEDNLYHAYIKGIIPYPTLSISHREWEDDDESYETNALILSRRSDGEITELTFSKDFGDYIARGGMTFGEMCCEQIRKLGDAYGTDV